MVGVRVRKGVRIMVRFRVKGIIILVIGLGLG